MSDVVCPKCGLLDTRGVRWDGHLTGWYCVCKTCGWRTPTQRNARIAMNVWEDGRMKQTWTYACTFRPPEAGLYPVDGFVSRDICTGVLPDGRKFYGYVHYDRPLTYDEVKSYMLVYFGWDGVSE